MTPDQLSAYKIASLGVIGTNAIHDYRRHRISSCAADYADQTLGPCKSIDHSDAKQSSSYLPTSSASATLAPAVLAQFCYVSAKPPRWSYSIRYAIEEIRMTPGFAANYLTGTMVCASYRRFTDPVYQPLRAA